MGRPVKFYTDDHVAHAVAHGLRLRGVDALTVVDAGLLGATDEEQLEWATTHGRVLFTQDKDFLRLQATGLAHAGIVYAARTTPIGEIVHGLHFMFQVLEAEDMEGRLEYL